jgi:hypothetical protein
MISRKSGIGSSRVRFCSRQSLRGSEKVGTWQVGVPIGMTNLAECLLEQLTGNWMAHAFPWRWASTC